jgi:hypothetical protein
MHCKRVWALCSLLVTVCACSPSEKVERARRETGNLRVALYEARFDEIYNRADPHFRQTTSIEEWRQLAEAVVRKLGTVKSAEEVNWHLNFTPAGTIVALEYETQYANGRAYEVFTWRFSGGDPSLLGYNVNSQALILN